MKTRPLIGSLSLVIGHWSFVIPSSAAAATDDASLRPAAYQGSINQDYVRSEASKLSSELSSLLDELRRNGFPPAALAEIERLSGQLDQLGDTDMAAISAALRAASQAPEPGSTRAAATTAYAGQQSIEARLKTIARTLAIRHLRDGLQRQLERLIVRQLANRRETAAAATAGRGALTVERYELTLADQRGVAEDLSTLLQTGDTLAQRLAEPSAVAGAATPAPTFTERVNGPALVKLADDATEAIRRRAHADALPHQDALLRELQALLQSVQSSQSRSQRIAAALQQVQTLQQQQQTLADTPTTPANRRAQSAAQQALANQAAATAAALAPVDSTATAQLQQARAQMEAAANPSANPAPTPPPASEPSTTSTPPAQAAADALAKTAATLSQALAEAQAGETAAIQAASTATTAAQSSATAASEALTNPPATPASPAAANSPSSENSAASANPSSPPSAAAALGQAIAQTQQAINAAQNAGAALAPEVGNALAQAGSALASARQQQAAGNLPAAQSQLSRAQSALAQAQTGLQAALAATSGNTSSALAQSPGENLDARPSSDPGDEGGEGGGDGNLIGAASNKEGVGQALGALTQAERDALAVLQNEIYPAEYSAWIQQYWRNLSRAANP